MRIDIQMYANNIDLLDLSGLQVANSKQKDEDEQELGETTHFSEEGEQKLAEQN